MQMKSRQLGLTLCLGAALALTGLTACESMDHGDRTAGRVKDDKTVNSRVKKALDDSAIYKFPDVRTQTYAGVVQLSGFVDSQEQRIQAVTIAQNIEGVHEVVNSLVLKPQETMSTMTPTGNPNSRRYIDASTLPPGSAAPNQNPGTAPNPAPPHNQNTNPNNTRQTPPDNQP
jgi:hyperosmotically inducible protein